MAPAWAETRATLPEHVQRILGPERNVHLFGAMPRSIRWPDTELERDMLWGFSLLGDLPYTGVGKQLRASIIS